MTRRHPLLRRTTLGLGALVLVCSTTASCGFDAATNRVNAISMGTNDRDGQVDVLGVVVVSAQPGSGTLLATLVNNDPSEPASLDTIEGASQSPIEVSDLQPVEVAPRGQALLRGDDAVPVTGEFVPGDFVSVSFGFANGEQSTLDVPVVPACRQWEGLDTSASESADPQAAPSAGDVASSGAQGVGTQADGKGDKSGTGDGGGSSAEPSPTAETSPSASAEESESPDAIAYECELPEPAAE